MAVPGVECPQLIERLRPDGPDAIRRPIESVIVKADHDIIGADLEVGLDEPVPEVDGAGEGLHGVLGPKVATAPVGDRDGWNPLWREASRKSNGPRQKRGP